MTTLAAAARTHLPSGTAGRRRGLPRPGVSPAATEGTGAVVARLPPDGRE
ncbi:hypothetical protein ACFQ2B_29890 [Streptomyces stramineus]